MDRFRIEMCKHGAAGMVVLAAAVGACGAEAGDHAVLTTACGHPDGGACARRQHPERETASARAPFVAGDNVCYMARGYFPRVALEGILPRQLAIPDDSVMQRHYPETGLRDDAHPFMISFCHGSGIHDLLTMRDVPEQEEIMFVFPVMYRENDGDGHLCSYVPVLYLDSLPGVIGGLVFGLRKEHHPAMEHGDDAFSDGWWRIDGIVDASFEPHSDDALSSMPSFVQQTYANPFVTVSYPLPVPKTVFYEAVVHPHRIRKATGTFSWQYQGTTVQSDDDAWSIYSEYSFTMSLPVSAAEYFGR
jgi:hypothetical protein